LEAGGVSSQIVIGLDLAKTSLPDAIAAMVEAWYEAQEIERPSYEIDYEGRAYYEWHKWYQSKGLNRQTARAYIEIISGNPTTYEEFEKRVFIKVPCKTFSNWKQDCITKLQAAQIERLIERRNAGESLQQLRRNPIA